MYDPDLTQIALSYEKPQMNNLFKYLTKIVLRVLFNPIIRTYTRISRNSALSENEGRKLLKKEFQKMLLKMAYTPKPQLVRNGSK
jgi:hypothetical protein